MEHCRRLFNLFACNDCCRLKRFNRFNRFTTLFNGRMQLRADESRCHLPFYRFANDRNANKFNNNQNDFNRFSI